MRVLLVKTKDNIKTRDKVGEHKPWFNGIKYFALKILPPKN